MKKNILLIPIFFLILFNLGCKKTLTGPENPFTLSIEDVSCTEAWIKLSVNNVQLPAHVSLLRDEKEVMNFTLTTKDTTVYTDSLLPKRTYTYHAVLQSSDNKQLTSNKTAAVTMDTTSHQFTWQTFTFGEYDNSGLNDVAIINENNIWAVGEIYLKDSLGNQDPTPYNAVHWDGSKWEVKRITVLFRGNYITPPIYGIFALSEKEIWLSSGVPIKGDGKTWTQYHLFDMGILTQQDGYLTKIWGSSPNDIYYVGTLGTIAHFDGKIWKKIEIGTDLHVYDIWGDFNTKTKEYEILAVASHVLEGSEKKIFQIKGTTAIAISAYPIGYSLTSVWFIPNKHYYVVGSGIYEKITLSNNEWKNRPLDITRYSTVRIRGNGINDIFAVGAFGEVLHFNGVTWKSYIGEGTGINGAYVSLALKNNFLVIVGYVDRKACITIGKR